MSGKNREERFDEDRDKVKSDQADVESAERDLAQRENQSTSKVKDNGSETTGKNRNDSDQLSDEELEEKIERVLESIIEEVSLEQEQEQLLEKMQAKTKEEILEALETLESLKQELLRAKNSDDLNVESLYDSIIDVCNRFNDSATNIHRFTIKTKHLLAKEIKFTVEEERKIEKLSERIPKDLEFMKDELEGLTQDFREIREVEEAGTRANEIETLERRELQLEDMEEKIDQELQKELREAKKLTKDDKELTGLLENSIKGLKALKSILNDEQSFLGANPPLENIENTINTLKSVLEQEEAMIEDLNNLNDELLEESNELSNEQYNNSSNFFKRFFIVILLVLTSIVMWGQVSPG